MSHHDEDANALDINEFVDGFEDDDFPKPLEFITLDR
jgi:hypothetical protein